MYEYYCHNYNLVFDYDCLILDVTMCLNFDRLLAK